MSFAAKYPGRCTAGYDTIEVGDDVEFGEGGIQHVACAPRLDLPIGPVCADCFLIHPEGACDA